MQKMLNKDLGEIRINKQMNNTVSKWKNALEGITSRIIEGEKWISGPGDRAVEITTREQNKEKRNKKWRNL